MKSVIGVLVVLMVALSLVLGACAGASPAPAGAPSGAAKPASAQKAEPVDPEWQKVIDAARKEGKVVYYGAAENAEVAKKASESLGREYGITVEFSGQRGSEMKEKVLAEVRAGRVIADIGSTGATSMLSLKREGALEKPGNLPNAKFVPKELLDPDGLLTAFQVNTYGILVNTNLVKPQDEPKSWKDLLDPKWKGKLLSDDPRAAGGGNTFFVVTYREFGRSFHEKLKEQQVHFTREYLENPKATARGDFPVYFPLKMLDHYANLQGTPTKPIVPQEGLTYVPISAGLIKGSSHPNAARVFLNWLLSEEGQRELTKVGAPAIRGDIDLGIPKEVMAHMAGTAKLLGRQSDEDLVNANKYTQEAEAIYGK